MWLQMKVSNEGLNMRRMNQKTEVDPSQLSGFIVEHIDAGEKSVTITLGVGAASIINWSLRQAAKDQGCNNPNLALAVAERLNTARLHFYEGAPLVDQYGKPICENYTGYDGVEISGTQAVRLQTAPKQAESKPEPVTAAG